VRAEIHDFDECARRTQANFDLRYIGCRANYGKEPQPNTPGGAGKTALRRQIDSRSILDVLYSRIVGRSPGANG
jgi:hypothetical protein